MSSAIARWIRSLLAAGQVKAYASISTETIERFRDHAAAHGLTASREHYEWILAARERCTARGRSR